MGIVKISDEIHEELRKASKVFDRSLNAQAEHWIKIGMLAELHPKIDYQGIRNFLFENQNLEISKIIKKAKK
jgi:hypothetical protein